MASTNSQVSRNIENCKRRSSRSPGRVSYKCGLSRLEHKDTSHMPCFIRDSSSLSSTQVKTKPPLKSYSDIDVCTSRHRCPGYQSRQTMFLGVGCWGFSHFRQTSSFPIESPHSQLALVQTAGWRFEAARIRMEDGNTVEIKPGEGRLPRGSPRGIPSTLEKKEPQLRVCDRPLPPSSQI